MLSKTAGHLNETELGTGATFVAGERGGSNASSLLQVTDLLACDDAGAFVSAEGWL